MTHTTKKRIAWGGVGLFAAAIVLLTMFPPISGYYVAGAWTYLDGSSGYLHLRDGKIDVLNISGESGDSRVGIGTYQRQGQTITFNIIHPKSETLVARIGLTGLTWQRDLVAGRPEYNFCARVWIPSTQSRLDKVKTKSLN